LLHLYSLSTAEEVACQHLSTSSLPAPPSNKCLAQGRTLLTFFRFCNKHEFLEVMEGGRKAFGQALDLKDDPTLMADYVKYHENVWPEILESLSQIGISKMKIFLLGTHLFMYYEGPADFDPKRDFQRYTALTPKAEEWDTWMRTFQQKVKEAGPEDWWTPMVEVFDLESQLARHRQQQQPK